VFDYVRKPMLWRALDAGRLAELETKISYQLKTVQDLEIGRASC